VSDFYESDRAVSEYLLFHYGTAGEVLPWSSGPVEGLDYPVRCVEELLDAGSLPDPSSALDLGCAVGRSTFQLARYCESVLGIDFSARFVAECQALQNKGRRGFDYVVEGGLTVSTEAVVDHDTDRTRVRFEQGDACGLRGDLGRFDVVLMANLLCRLPDPDACLGRMAGLIPSGGQLLITTPCTWMEDYTPRERWLGGFHRDGKPVRTLDSLKERLTPDFELEIRRDMPFLIREHERKFQWTVAQGTRWRRR